MKPGYKQTEVGVIPEDWEVREIGSFEPFVTSGSRGWADYYADSGQPFVRIGNMSRSSIKLDLDDLQFVRLPPSETEGTRTQLLSGDVLVSITADIGIIGYVDDSLPKPAYINQHIALVRIVAGKAESKFCSYFLASAAGQKFFRSITDIGAKAGINLNAVRSALVALPSLPEQRAIAEALSDVDGLLDGLDRLIAKKRDLKQAAMQQLLTAQTRLPGFHGEWCRKPLSRVCSMKSGEGITSAKMDSHSQFPCYGGNGLRGYTSTYTHEGSFALIGRQGALCGNVLQVNGRFFASEHAIVVTAAATSDIRWFAYVLGRMNLNQYSESSAQPGLSVSKLLHLEVDAPPSKAEQTAIAEVLGEMGGELAALERRREKTCALKQAMMQELLTGKTRLI